MAYEITPQDFCLIVKNPRCRGTENANANAEVGHENCGHCKGNYFVGGECNYGGRHEMEKDLKYINQNFRAFDVLVQKQAKISGAKNENSFNHAKDKLLDSFQELKKRCEDEAGAGFFYGSCIGLDGSQSQFAERIKTTFKRLAKELDYYIKQVTSSTWEQLKNFQEKLDKLDKMQSESNQLAKDWKNEKDPVKKAKLFALLSQKNSEIKSFQAELKNDPVYSLYSTEKSDELANIVKNIFHGNPNTSFFTWKKKSDDKDNTKTNQEKYLGFIPKEAGKTALIVIGGLLSLVFLYYFFKRKFSK